MRLTDKQWEKIEDLIPDGPVRSDGKGRLWRDKREVLEGILWIVLKKSVTYYHMASWTSDLNRLSSVSFILSLQNKYAKSYPE